MSRCCVCDGCGYILRDVCPLCDGVAGWPEQEANKMNLIARPPSDPTKASRSDNSCRKIILDIETGDPDDLMNLFLLAGHPLVEVLCVLVTPGSPAQMLLVHEALRRLAENAGLHYLNSIPLGYFDIDHVKSQENPLASVMGQVYVSLFPHWRQEVDRVFGPAGDKARLRKREAREAPKAGRGKKEARAEAKQIELVDHQRLKDHVLGKLASEGRDLVEGWRLLVDLCNEKTVLMTGGPVTNLGQAVRESLQPDARKRLVLGRWCAQGGFAGANVIPAGAFTLEKFQGKQTCATFNFDSSRPDAEAALSYDGIMERFLCSKNVCHQILFDKDLESRLTEHVSRGAPAAPQGGAVFSSLGLTLFHEMMGVYKNASEKKLHDIVAGLCAIDPAYSGCCFRRVQLELMNSEAGDKKLQWGCKCAVGPALWPEPGDDGQLLLRSSGNDGETNAWISVDVDIEKFKYWLVGHT